MLGLGANAENGWEVPASQKKADKGSVVHKILELLASKKLAEQQGLADFADAELGASWPAASFTVDDAVEAAWRHYTTRGPFVWDARDYRDVRAWTHEALHAAGGLFNPLRREVLWPEKYFDLTIDRPWARYRYDTPDGPLEGCLAIKGTMDLTVRVDGRPDAVELVDWKTGMRKDWATGLPKDWRKLRDDPQLRLYHYALARLLPEVEHIVITIVYVQDGGPFSLDFGPDDLARTEQMLRERFEAVRDCQRPRRILNDPEHSWKCKRLCVFGKNNWPGTGRTACEHVHRELVALGMERVTARYGRSEAFRQYGSGGGMTQRA